MALDPNKNTREEFTLSLTEGPLPSNASIVWKSQAQQLRSLHTKLAYHKAMEPNLHQTYAAPAASKDKVYFMWDFIGRTLGTLYQVPPNLPASMSAKEKAAWSDVTGRTIMAANLILDTNPGMLDMMVQAPSSKEADFGPEILGIAKEINA